MPSRIVVTPLPHSRIDPSAMDAWRATSPGAVEGGQQLDGRSLSRLQPRQPPDGDAPAVALNGIA